MDKKIKKDFKDIKSYIDKKEKGLLKADKKLDRERDRLKAKLERA